jgi:hypothetical protein
MQNNGNEHKSQQVTNTIVTKGLKQTEENNVLCACNSPADMTTKIFPRKINKK